MGGKLKDSEIEDLVAWVKAGAVWPRVRYPPLPNSPATSTSSRRSREPSGRCCRLKNPPAPAVKDASWARTDIDRFVLAQLEKEGLKPVRAAARHDLIRRATLDLTGLPPTPEEIAAFEKDTSPDAFAKVVDRLLASPHYGERWGRIWLDVARYGEDDYRSLNPNPRGYHPYPNAYLYRDWVIQAFNDDLPYDQFVKAQLAGDLLDAKIRYKMLPATGFLGLGPWYYDNGAVEVTRADERHDRVDVVTRGFLGLTVACARCHDHKYDPIPTADYYSLAGVFVNTAYHEYPLVPKAVLDEYTKLRREVEKKQKMLQEMQQNLGSQLSESLAFQTSNYLQGVYEVGGQKKEADDGGGSAQARLRAAEALDQVHGEDHRQVPQQGSLAGHDEEGRGGAGGGRGGRAWAAEAAQAAEAVSAARRWTAWRRWRRRQRSPEVKKLADEFQANVVEVMLERKDLNEENEIIAAKALEGTKKKKRANKPNEFITNDDFCPGLRAAAEEHAGRGKRFLDRDFPARTEGCRRSGGHDGGGRTRRRRRACCCSAAGDWKAASAPSRRRS